MKLANKINLRFLFLLVIVFSFAGGVLYFELRYAVDKNIDEILDKRLDLVLQTIHENPKLELINQSLDQSIKMQIVAPCKTGKLYTDTIMDDKHEHELVDFRRLEYVGEINHQFYQIKITLSSLEAQDMAEMILYFMFGLFACIVVMLSVFNRYLSSSVWSPFYKTLEQIKNFKIGQKAEIKFEDTDITEFTQLNGVLAELELKVQTDFQNLKEFTENASHEIQTPLAIITSKLETVLQDQALLPSHQKQLQIAFKTVSRLSKLNEGLLLLSKIENKQFGDEVDINFCELIKDRAEFIEELLAMKNITISLELEKPFLWRMNPYLAEILVNNLLGNAMKHNVKDGKIMITSHTDKLIFANPGESLGNGSEKIFQRFVKQSAKNESTGLGLSIASEICTNQKLSLKYSYEEKMHLFTIFKNS